MNKNPSFKASTGRYRHWKKRHGVSTCYKTSLAQRLPKNAEIKVTNFHHFVIQQRQKHSCSLHNIINMDETPVRFDMPGKKTLALQGSRTVPIATIGVDKECFTVVLAVRGDGEKMDPVVIFKGVQMPKDLRVPKDIVVQIQEKGWMDEESCKLWIKDIKTCGECTLLVWDSFRGHLTDGVKSYAKKCKIDQAVIPGGLTGILQPLDVVINKPFKDRLRQLWQDWMINGKHQFKASGKQKKPTKNQVLQWTEQS